MDGLTEGRIVHFVMPNGEHRPAIVVKVWSKESGVSNLQVFTDGHNDARFGEIPPEQWGTDSIRQVESGLWWRTSVLFDDQEKKPGTYHWIERA